MNEDNESFANNLNGLNSDHNLTLDHQDDVIVTIRRLDRQYKSKALYCGCHVMTYAKITSIVSLLLTLLMCLLFIIGPLNKLHLVSETLVFLVAVCASGSMFMAVNRRKPIYCWPYVAFTSSASFYCITWFVIYSTGFMEARPSVVLLAIKEWVIANLVIWALSSLLYAWFTIIGYQLFMYLKAYNRVYEAAALNILSGTSLAQGAANELQDDVIISRGRDSDLSNNYMENRTYGRLV